MKVWWLPITSADWRLAKAKKRTVNSKMKAKNDGILHAMISVNDPSRGFLRLYVADDLAAPNKPAASASVHYYEPHDRWITHASAMLPVQSGSPYRVGHEITHGAPTVSAWWTGIIPA